MTDLLTQDAVIATIWGLTQDRLLGFIAAEAVLPVHTESGPAFRRIDIARLRLLCELSDDLDLDDHAAAIVMALIEQLHDTRFALHTIARALADAPDDVKSHIAAALRPPVP